MKIIYTNKGEEIFVDDEDYEELNSFTWYVLNNGYAMRTPRKGHHKRMLMHRLIMDCPNGMFVDHINHDKLDNQKQNLRICTRIENCQNKNVPANNTSGVVGVTWHEYTRNWEVGIKINKEHIYLGVFEDFDEAVKIRKEAEEKYYGEFRNVDMKIDEEVISNSRQKNTSRKTPIDRKPMPNNTSGVTGVTWRKRNNKWVAYIRVNTKKIHIGYYVNLEDAIKARKDAELKYYGRTA